MANKEDRKYSLQEMETRGELKVRRGSDKRKKGEGKKRKRGQ